MTWGTKALAATIIVLFGALGGATAQRAVTPETSDIAGTPIVGVHCEEDETIFWVGVDTLGCVHADTFEEERA